MITNEKGGTIMTTEQLELEAFRQIRHKIKEIEDYSSNNEIAGYVKGVVDLETELYSILSKEKEGKWEKLLVRWCIYDSDCLCFNILGVKL